jgi:hypothetical protein
MKIFSLIIISALLIVKSFGAQINDDEIKNRPYFQLQRIHLDFTSAIYINDISLSSDFEIYKTHIQTFGLQPGYSYLLAGDAAETEYGSPFQDINLLAYTSIGYDKPITTQLLIGYNYRISSKSYAKEYPVSGLKYGISFNFNLNKYFKIYVKYSAFSSSANYGKSAVGLGISIGWSK